MISLIDQPNIAHASARFVLWKGFFDKNDIRLKHGLAGGALMDLGVYPLGALRQIFGTEPVEVLESTGTPVAGADPLVDQKFSIKYAFPNGATAQLDCDMNAQGGYRFPFFTSRLPEIVLPVCSVTHRPKPAPPSAPDLYADKNLSHTITTTITMYNFVMATLWHRIDILDAHSVINSEGKVVKTWNETHYQKCYKWDDGDEKKGEDSWLTYRYMLEAFVDKIRGQEPAHWVSGEDSIAQMKAVDMAYEKSDLPVRDTSAYRL